MDKIFLFLLLLLPVVAYVVYVMNYFFNWKKIKTHSINQNTHFPFVSVLIPARNEAAHVRSCIQSLQKQQYPKTQFEIILINDHSTDDTAMIASEMDGVKVVQLPVHTKGKKSAIEAGVRVAKGSVIVTTDADTDRGENWLKTLVDALEQKQLDILTAPVLYQQKSQGFLSIFQQYDLLAMAGITGAAIEIKRPEMANGANLVFRKSFFEQSGGYAENAAVAGGDDIFLFLKADNMMYQSGYLLHKDAIVFSYPERSIRSFFNQRMRWLAKSFALPGKRILLTLSAVYLFHLLLITFFIAGFFKPLFFIAGISSFFIKGFVDMFFVNSVSKKLGYPLQKPFLYPLIQLMHVFYVIWAGPASFYKKIEWKGRVYESNNKQQQQSHSTI